MRAILLDENIPAGVRKILAAYDVRTVQDMGWAGLTNGRLLTAAEAHGFEIMVTGDKNLREQQNFTRRKLALVILDTTGWPTIREYPERLADAIPGALAGSHVLVSYPRPRLRRRPPPHHTE
jgi:hypothetical protein